MNAVEALIRANNGDGSQVENTSPTEGPEEIPEPIQNRFGISFNIIAVNLGSLFNSIDGDPSGEALITVSGSSHRSKEEEKKAVSRTLYSELHNFVSSVYSYHEQVRTVVNHRTEYSISKKDISPDKCQVACCEYVEKLLFIYGIRHGMQHGNYRFLDLDKIGSYRDLDVMQLQFLEDVFEESRVEDEEKYIEYYNSDNPIQHIAEYREHLIEFHNDVTNWMS